MRRFHRLGTLLVALLLALTSASAVLAQSPVASPGGSPTASTHGVQTAHMDLLADPAQDFYQYANGGWLARTEIPADSPRYGNFEFDDRIDRSTASLSSTR